MQNIHTCLWLVPVRARCWCHGGRATRAASAPGMCPGTCWSMTGGCPDSPPPPGLLRVTRADGESLGPRAPWWAPGAACPGLSPPSRCHTPPWRSCSGDPHRGRRTLLHCCLSLPDKELIFNLMLSSSWLISQSFSSLLSQRWNIEACLVNARSPGTPRWWGREALTLHWTKFRTLPPSCVSAPLWNHLVQNWLIGLEAPNACSHAPGGILLS